VSMAEFRVTVPNETEPLGFAHTTTVEAIESRLSNVYGKGTLRLRNRVVMMDDVLDANNLYDFVVANVPGMISSFLKHIFIRPRS
jgi:hypothetical protein